MKKAVIVLGTAILMLMALVGCDINADIESNGHKLVIGGIYVEPDGWKAYRVDNQFSHLYADIEMPEITEHIYNMGTFRTYLEYGDKGVDGKVVLVQEAEGMTKAKWRYENGERKEYTETIRCGYSVGNLRIEISRSDFYNRPPDETMYFRTVILW